MTERDGALRRRIAPSVPLKLELEDDDSDKFTKNFRLSFDANAMTLIEERTGFSVFAIWEHLSAKNVSITLWAALLAHHEEYDSEEGLVTIRSYMDAGNMEQITKALSDAFVASLSKEKQEAFRKAQARAEELERAVEAFMAANPGVTPKRLKAYRKELEEKRPLEFEPPATTKALAAS